MYSRNQTTITSRCKHRQPVFLHPTEECSGVGCEALEIAPRLPIPSLSSTLHVFQFIPWNPVEFSRGLATVYKHWAKDKQNEECMRRLRSSALPLAIAVL